MRQGFKPPRERLPDAVALWQDEPMRKRCPREGIRVKFTPNMAAAMFYSPGTHPPIGAEGTITTLPTGRGRATCMPGPRGGLVYVDWKGWGTVGVFRQDLTKLTSKSLRGAHR